MIKISQHADFLDFLKRAELFSNLLDDDLAYVAERSELLSLPAGAAVFSVGEKARRFFIVKEGVVSVYRADERGEEREMARYLEGDVLGDFDFALGTKFDARGKAETEVQLIAFPGGGKCMEELAQEKPDTTARILLRSLSMISSRLRSTQRLISENAPWVRELRRQIYTDPGTGLWSRAFLDEELPRLVTKPTSFVLVKPDRFKELNDAHGHSAGDGAMGLIAELLSAEVEALGRGWALRLRSNETALVIPSCGADEGVRIARRLTAGIPALKLSFLSAAGPGTHGASPEERFRLTASVALSVWPEDEGDWRKLVESSCGVLTRAWQDGGNRIYRLKSRGQEGGR
jgi:diguanylate cyclase (GGDEF)-like protein